jgi:hypothetical protein
MTNYPQAYSALAWPIFPCSSASKAPLTPHGFKDATTDLVQIEAWAKSHPGCAWGVATADTLGVIDIDPRHGGDVEWNKLVAEHGPLPPTVCCRTGGGGAHYYFVLPKGTASGKDVVGKGIDVKANGGYVIIPPSRIFIPEHKQPYAWEVSPWRGKVAQAPEWLAGLLTAKPRAKGGDAHRVAPSRPAQSDPWTVQPGHDLRSHPGASEGARRRTRGECLAWHAGHGVGSVDEVAAWAEAWAERCSPPFVEWAKHVRGYAHRLDGDAGESHSACPDPVPDSLGGGADAGKEGRK